MRVLVLVVAIAAMSSCSEERVQGRQESKAPPPAGSIEISGQPHALEVPRDILEQDDLLLQRHDLARQLSTTSSTSIPFGADFRDTSEFMVGDVWITVVLFQSTGEKDPKTESWTASRIMKVKSELEEGARWWEETFRRETSFSGNKHSLKFKFNFEFADTPVKTKYEPISHPHTDEELFINSFLDKVGYNDVTSYFTDLSKWNNDQRIKNQTNWAFTVFIADSGNDADDKFSDGFFAYTYLGGPFMMMTSGNGGWGLMNLGQVFAHELGHVFYALDEYPGSASVNDSSGYYNVKNANAYDDNPNPDSRVDSIMAEAERQDRAYPNYKVSASAKNQIGWRDSDQNGLVDVLDVPLSLAVNDLARNPGAPTYPYEATMSAQTIQNLNPRGNRHSLTLNLIDAFQSRLNGGLWIDTHPVKDYAKTIQSETSLVAGQTNVIEYRAIGLNPAITSNVVKKEIADAVAGGVRGQEPEEPLLPPAPVMHSLKFAFNPSRLRCESASAENGLNVNVLGECSTYQLQTLSGVSLRNEKLRGSNFFHSSFLDSDLRGSDFSYSRLLRASFSGSDLRAASFAKALVRSVNFQGANLQNADFSGADFRFAKLEGANLTGATFDRATWLPFSQAEAVSRGMIFRP